MTAAHISHILSGQQTDVSARRGRAAVAAKAEGEAGSKFVSFGGPGAPPGLHAYSSQCLSLTL